MSEKLVKLGIPKGEIYKTTLISPAQAEKLTWKKRDGTVKQLSERQLKVLHDEYVTKNDGKLQVASVADERPAVVRDVSSMFGALPTLEQAAAAFNPVPVVEAPLPDFLQVPDWLK
jgi:molybdopterin-guanine dinucleotide biosynthesis protein